MANNNISRTVRFNRYTPFQNVVDQEVIEKATEFGVYKINANVGEVTVYPPENNKFKYEIRDTEGEMFAEAEIEIPPSIDDNGNVVDVNGITQYDFQSAVSTLIDDIKTNIEELADIARTIAAPSSVSFSTPVSLSELRSMDFGFTNRPINNNEELEERLNEICYQAFKNADIEFEAGKTNLYGEEGYEFRPIGAEPGFSVFIRAEDSKVSIEMDEEYQKLYDEDPVNNYRNLAVLIKEIANTFEAQKDIEATREAERQTRASERQNKENERARLHMTRFGETLSKADAVRPNIISSAGLLEYIVTSSSDITLNKENVVDIKQASSAVTFGSKPIIRIEKDGTNLIISSPQFPEKESLTIELGKENINVAQSIADGSFALGKEARAFENWLTDLKPVLAAENTDIVYGNPNKRIGGMKKIIPEPITDIEKTMLTNYCNHLEKVLKTSDYALGDYSTPIYAGRDSIFSMLMNTFSGDSLSTKNGTMKVLAPNFDTRVSKLIERTLSRGEFKELGDAIKKCAEENKDLGKKELKEKIHQTKVNYLKGKRPQLASILEEDKKIAEFIYNNEKAYDAAEKENNKEEMMKLKADLAAVKKLQDMRMGLINNIQINASVLRYRIWDFMKDVAKNRIDWIKSTKLVKAVVDFKNAIVNGLNEIKQFLQSLPQKGLDAMGKAAKAVGHEAVNIYNGIGDKAFDFVNRIDAKTDDLEKAFKPAADSISAKTAIVSKFIESKRNPAITEIAMVLNDAKASFNSTKSINAMPPYYSSYKALKKERDMLFKRTQKIDILTQSPYQLTKAEKAKFNHYSRALVEKNIFEKAAKDAIETINNMENPTLDNVAEILYQTEMNARKSFQGTFNIGVPESETYGYDERDYKDLSDDEKSVYKDSARIIAGNVKGLGITERVAEPEIKGEDR